MNSKAYQIIKQTQGTIKERNRCKTLNIPYETHNNIINSNIEAVEEFIFELETKLSKEETDLVYI